MITLDDLAAGVKARCAAAAEFAAALPGGAWHDRGPDAPAGNYAVFKLELAGEPEFDSSGAYLQGYTLRVAAYSYLGESPATAPQATQLALASALNAGPSSWAALRAGRVMSCLPKGYDGEHADRLREGRDVFASAGQWSLIVDGSL